MSTNLLVYKNDPVRSVVIDGVRWFRANDIGKGFGYVNSSQLTTPITLPHPTARRWPAPEKSNLFINFTGVFRAFNRCHLGSAVPFYAWLEKQYPNDAVIEDIEDIEEPVEPFPLAPPGAYKKHLDDAIESTKATLGTLLQSRALLYGDDF